MENSGDSAWYLRDASRG